MSELHRAVGVVLKDGKLLVMHRKRDGQEYYSVPGGGIEPGETPEEAVVRELLEETSISVRPIKKLHEAKYDEDIRKYKQGASQHFFLCEYLSGEPQLGEGNEKFAHNLGISHYEPMWIDPENPDLPLYPDAMMGILEKLK